MVYSKAPTAYYSTLHDSITSLCKTILPLGLKKRGLVSADHRLWQLHSDNLKWQQDSLRQMLNLVALHNDDILSEADLSAFRTHLLHTLLASPPPQLHHPLLIKDKLIFLQELLHAKCISEGEYHSSRRPLLVRMTLEGGEIEGRDVMIAGSKGTKQTSEEEWSEIDLKDEQCLMNKENSNSKKTSSKHARNQVVKAATSVFNFGSSNKHGKNSMEKSIFDSPTLHMHSPQSRIPSPSVCTQSELRHSKENNPFWDGPEKMKRKPFRTLFHRDKSKREGHGGGGDHGVEAEKSAKKQWGFDGLRKLKKSDPEDDTVPLSLNESSDSEAYLASYQLSSYGEVSMKNKMHSNVSPSDFSVVDDKVLVDKIKKELPRIPTEMRSTNTNFNFLNDQKQTISTKLPEEKAELKNYNPKPWCDRYGGVVLDVVKKDHVGEMKNMRNDGEEKHENTMGWTTFEDDENLHPNLSVQDKSLRNSSINPFSQG
ncbi:uncharacterized protein LOC109790510 [Cajanus cajan]|uniref:Uncharacterized protein n=1 Tax=Cajanus cajan TaxID=3821 RepID=A0A151R2R4_CAJCA|nr:uncharacterized protein LOC109790510 [Cajanus cajan]KYP36851.1 hypothetical protein KK1_041983 [Cajanus cajan]